MKRLLSKFWCIPFLLPLAATPLHAQTNPGQLAVLELSGPESLIGLAGVIMGCSIPIFVVGFQLYFRHQKNKMLHETIRSMVDKGTPIPPELLTISQDQPYGAARSHRRDLRTGLLLLGVGIGVLIVRGKVGWIVIFLGLAFVVASIVEKKANNNVLPPKL